MVFVNNNKNYVVKNGRSAILKHFKIISSLTNANGLINSQQSVSRTTAPPLKMTIIIHE